MTMARIARSNRLPDSLPVVLKLLEAHCEGIAIPELQKEIEIHHLWNIDEYAGPRALYYRIYSVLKFLANKGIVRQVHKPGKESIWILDREEYARQRRKELFEVIQPFVDGCMMISDPRQLLGQLSDLIEEGTVDVLLAERRSKGRQPR